MKRIRFQPNVPAEVRAINQRAAMNILQPLSGMLAGLLRLRVGSHRVLFDETADTITIHRVGDRRDVYR